MEALLEVVGEFGVGFFERLDADEGRVAKHEIEAVGGDIAAEGEFHLPFGGAVQGLGTGLDGRALLREVVAEEDFREIEMPEEGGLGGIGQFFLDAAEDGVLGGGFFAFGGGREFEDEVGFPGGFREGVEAAEVRLIQRAEASGVAASFLGDGEEDEGGVMAVDGEAGAAFFLHLAGGIELVLGLGKGGNVVPRIAGE